ncbi:hypothetical protein M422DRAFT_265102 [Sphaerobolus stellatus SS14]|uniref:Uncharacterized protein n=1 Tax=Sphaerobolus stellatus (strain SS14) TaxID=990650 RepID=A0A0C9UE64_SPHS4|nr:hypothetical protein M422DRAFT_265102 [Sphaerobolus stellatus SS14]
MDSIASAPSSAQPQSYATITAGQIPIPNSPTRSISPMDYMDSDDHTPINNEVATPTDESQVRNTLIPQQIKSNKRRAKEVTPAADIPATVGLPNFKKKKMSDSVDSPTGVPNSESASGTVSISTLHYAPYPSLLIPPHSQRLLAHRR